MIFTGEAYENIILDNNELYTFINTKSDISFRKYIIQLLNYIYYKCQKTYEEINKQFYVDYYLKHLEEIITNTNNNLDYKANDPWPENLNIAFTKFTNEQLIIIYQYVLLEDIKNLGITPTPITPINKAVKKTKQN